MSIDYGVVIEGTFELTLDSGEKKMMYPGDMSKYRHPAPNLQLIS